MHNIRAQHESTICMTKVASASASTHKKLICFLLGTGQMPHLMGGPVGVTLCHDDMKGIHPVVTSSHYIFKTF